MVFTTKRITRTQIKHLAKLSNIKLSDYDIDQLTPQVNDIVTYVNQLQSIDLTGIEEAHQVTGLKNVVRTDNTGKNVSLAQNDSISQAKNTVNGFFEVDAVFGEDHA